MSDDAGDAGVDDSGGAGRRERGDPGSGAADDYTVAVKPSARRLAAGAGTWVQERGPRRTFETKALARQWARDLSGTDRSVWIQDAHPLDEGPADGYLMARRVGGGERTAAYEQLGLDEA